MSRTTRLIALPLLALLATNAASMADDNHKPGKAARKAKESLSTDTLVTQSMAEAALDLPCPNLQFVGETPLKELLGTFETHWSKHLPYDLPFFPDYAELDLEGISSMEDVSAANIKIAGGTHTCRDALNLIFRQTTDPALSYQAFAGHIDVTTLAKTESEVNMASRVYNVSEFIGGKPAVTVTQPKPTKQAPKKQQKQKQKQTHKASNNTPQKLLKQFGGGGGLGGASPNSGGAINHSGDNGLSLGKMITLIQEQTSPPAKWFDTDGEGGKISILGQYLVIRQTPSGHRQVDNTLNQLRDAIKTGGAPYIKPGTGAGTGFLGTGGMGGGGFGGGGQPAGGSGLFHVQDSVE